MSEHGVDGRRGALLHRFHHRLEVGCHPAVYLNGFPLGQQSLGFQPCPEGVDGIPLVPALELPFGTVFGLVRPGVTGVAVSLHLQQGGAPTRARNIQSRAHRLDSPIGILSVDDDPRDAVGGGPVGQVFDIGYQRYEGPRGGRAQARAAIFIDGIKAALGIGRGGRAKILPWLFLVVAIIPALVMAFIAGLLDRTMGDVDLPTHSQYYGVAVFILFLFAATAGPELLCPDRRSNVINLYLIRPLTTADYVGARWLAFLVVMLFAAWLPQLVLLTGLVLGAPEPGVYLQENWLDIPKFLRRLRVHRPGRGRGGVSDWTAGNHDGRRRPDRK